MEDSAKYEVPRDDTTAAAEALAHMQAHVELLEKRLGLSKGYVRHLGETASDFEFVIKLAVLAEAITTQALVSRLREEALADHIANISQATRIDMCVKLALLRPEDAGPLRVLTQVRNKYAHRVENLELSLEKFADRQDPQLLANWFNALFDKQGKEAMTPAGDMLGLVASMRQALFTLCVGPLVMLAYQGHLADAQQQLAALQQDYLKHTYAAEEARRGLKKWGLDGIPTNALSDMFRIMKAEHEAQQKGG